MSIQSELLAIKGDGDLLTAEDVVKWARNHPKSELYRAPQFLGWNTEKAAEAHFLLAARWLIKLHITYEGGESKFVSLTSDRASEGGGYRDIDAVVRDKSLYEVAMADALRELERIEARYNWLKALKPVWHAAKKIRTKTQKAASKKPHRGNSKRPSDDNRPTA